MKIVDINNTILRSYDIRGKYKEYLDESVAYTIGLSFGSYIKQYDYTKAIVGYDNRTSSIPLYNALVKGITETGIDVVSICLCTTPMFNFALKHNEIPCGIMITASHNPTNDNGFKITLKDYNPACGEELQKFYNFTKKKKFTTGPGIKSNIDISEEYISNIINNIDPFKKKLKVVIDPGNGTTSIIANDIFNQLNIELISINSESNPNFPNHHPDPSVKENMNQLIDTVLNNKADIGLSFDGDGDRIGVVDNEGKILPIDYLLAIFNNNLYDKYDNKNVIFDVKCSKTLIDEIIKHNRTPYMYRTGANFIKNETNRLKLPVGGEYSGHIIFNDRYIGIDDGIYAGLRLIEILSNNDTTIKKLTKNFTKYLSTEEIKVQVIEEIKFRIINVIKKYCLKKQYKFIDIDGIRIEYEDGFSLIRASNTGPNLTLRFESLTETTLMKRRNEIEELIKYIINNIKE